MRKELFGILVLSLFVVGINGIGHASLTDGLVAYYPFNGNANDESGNGNNGVVYGATLTADRAGTANSAYSFDGVNDYIDIANYSSINTGEITVMFWIKPKISYNSSTNRQTFICDDWGAYHMSYESGYLDFWLYDTNHTGKGFKHNVNFPAESWAHIGFVTKAGGNSIMYIDGTGYNLGNSPASFDETLHSLLIGSIPHLSQWVNGVIDDIRIYNRALSASEIQELYSGSAPPTCFDTGYTAGVAACKANPTSCGINVNPGTAVTLTPDLKMHLPNIQFNIPFLGSVSMWADLAYDGTKTDAGYFKVTGAGAN